MAEPKRDLPNVAGGVQSEHGARMPKLDDVVHTENGSQARRQIPVSRLFHAKIHALQNDKCPLSRTLLFARLQSATRPFGAYADGTVTR